MLGLKKLSNRGDTIVEVMIVLAVLGLAIGISYATANRSLLNARQAQENSSATERAQSQVEALRSLASSDSINIFTAGPFCINQTGDPANPYAQPQTGAACVSGGTVPYTTAVTYDSATQNFNVKITWPDVLGQGNDTVSMVYRVYKP